MYQHYLSKHFKETLSEVDSQQVHKSRYMCRFSNVTKLLQLFCFQTTVLQKAAATSTDNTCWWWIKGDGCDVVKGICESTKGEWSGDVDLNDGSLQRLYQQFRGRLQWTEGIGLQQRSNRDTIKSDLNVAMQHSLNDMEFIQAGKLLLLLMWLACHQTASNPLTLLIIHQHFRNPSLTMKRS